MELGPQKLSNLVDLFRGELCAMFFRGKYVTVFFARDDFLTAFNEAFQSDCEELL